MANTFTMSETKRTLTADAWARTALETIAREGVDSVAVESLARELDVTKGSFYWHFPSRDALLDAALKLWEKHETEDLLARVGNETDPYKRIVRAFTKVDASQHASRLYLALSAAGAHHPKIAEVVRRVSVSRLDHLVEGYRALGLSEQDAARWAAHAYSVYLGILHLRHDVPDALPEYGSPAYQGYMQHLIATLIPETHAREAQLRMKVA